MSLFRLRHRSLSYHDLSRNFFGTAKQDTLFLHIEARFCVAMVNTSQNLNLSYGYLWWLNGKTSVMVPTLQTVFPRSLCPNAPAEMIAAMGKNGQQLNIIPSKNLIVVRMGDSTDNSPVGFTLQDEIWAKLNTIIK